MATTGSKKRGSRNALKGREADFVRWYLRLGVGYKAALKAKYGRGKVKAAYEAASRLLKKKHIAREIKKGQEAAAKRLAITKDRLLKEEARIAFFDPRELYDDDGNLLPIPELDTDTAAAVAGVEVTVTTYGKDREFEDVKTKLKLTDKGAALKRIGDSLGIYNVKRLEHTGKDGGPIKVELHPAVKEKLDELCPQR